MPEDSLPRFAHIRAGAFGMGSDDGDEDERPVRRVQVDAFHISSHAITQDQYAAFVRATGHPAPTVRDLPRVVTAADESSFREIAAGYAWRGGEPPRGRERHPVTLVGFGDAVAYCAWLSTEAGLP
ncbi:MAG: formylglycine-generating enzyme family protein, partial [Vicinamibacterales bacterium]